MKCLIKIHHRPLIYSFFALASLLFLSAVGFVSDSYATVNTCNVSGGTSNVKIDSCGVSTPAYFKLVSYSITFNSTRNDTLNSFYISYATNNSITRLDYFTNMNISLSSARPYTLDSSDLPVLVFPNFGYVDGVATILTSNNPVLVYSRTSSSGDVTIYSADFVFEYSDNISELFDSSNCPEPEEPEPCPPLPENPYDDKLDEIKKAIYCASAVMIMIYFFFIVYKIIVKDGGRR